jgi:hypothetical protein
MEAAGACTVISLALGSASQSGAHPSSCDSYAVKLSGLFLQRAWIRDEIRAGRTLLPPRSGSPGSPGSGSTVSLVELRDDWETIDEEKFTPRHCAIRHDINSWANGGREWNSKTILGGDW